jgi:NSS family neurotransmitter:Na+ symporter
MDQQEKNSHPTGIYPDLRRLCHRTGNVWKFPYITVSMAAAAFVLIYITFLIILGIPIMVMELAVGRGSRRSTAMSMDVLEPAGTKWHWFKYFAMAGNYLLMMFYTTVAGWMLCFFIKMVKGDFSGMDSAAVSGEFRPDAGKRTHDGILYSAGHCLCFGVCAMGLQNGVERPPK